MFFRNIWRAIVVVVVIARRLVVGWPESLRARESESQRAHLSSLEPTDGQTRAGTGALKRLQSVPIILYAPVAS